MKKYVHAKICAQLFIERIFVTAQTWKQPKCPTFGEKLNSLFVQASTNMQ